MTVEQRTSRDAAPPAGRYAYLDNIKVLMVMGVIVAHAVFAFTGVGTWVFREEPLREPALSVITLLAVIGGMVGVAPFFLISGLVTPRSLQRKGFRRFSVDRLVRLGVPMALFVLVMSPFIEYVDPDNAGWDAGFAAFVPHIWWPPAPGPTWFLGVLLLFSLVYALTREMMPPKQRATPALSVSFLLAAAVVLAGADYLARLAVPLGEERFRLALGQAPAWVVAFAVGVVAGERGWFDAIPRRVARAARWMWVLGLVGAVAVFVGVVAAGSGPEAFAGGGTWQSAVLVVPESALVVGISVWMIDVFHRRFDNQGGLGYELSRAAYAAFFLHQGVLVLLVLASRRLGWPPEADFAAVGVLGVVFSFGVAMLLVRVPGLCLRLVHFAAGEGRPSHQP